MLKHPFFREQKYYRAIMATTEMSEEEFERVLEMVKMNVDMNGLEQLDALVIVLEEMGVNLNE